MKTLIVAIAASGVALCGHAKGGNEAGKALALKLCATCHDVANDQKQAPLLRPSAPSFREIAERPTTDAASLRDFLNSTHNSVSHPAAMPNPELSADQITEVSAYILSLRTSK